MLELTVIENFHTYSVELDISVMDGLRPVLEELGDDPSVALMIRRQPEDDAVARRLIRDVLGRHQGVVDDQPWET